MERLKMKDFPRRETDGGEVTRKIERLESCAAQLAEAAAEIAEEGVLNDDLMNRLRHYILTIDNAIIDVICIARARAAR